MMTFTAINLCSHFRHFEGVNAILTLAKHVGSLCIFYLPLTVASLCESAGKLSVDSILPKCCLLLLLLSPIANCILYGFKNKVSVSL